jgi:hypothetical protein
VSLAREALPSNFFVTFTEVSVIPRSVGLPQTRYRAWLDLRKLPRSPALRSSPLSSRNASEPADEADRGRWPGFARHEDLEGGSGSISLSFGLKVFAVETFASTLWEIELASGWSAEQEEECVTIIKSDTSGALQISAYQKRAGSISREELLDATVCDAETQTHLREKAWGDFSGFQLVYSEDDTFWRKWWLAKGRTLLFVTYNCELTKKDDEKAEINQMVESLAVPGRTGG